MKQEEIDNQPAGRATDIDVLVAMGFPRKKVFFKEWDVAKTSPHYIPSGKPQRTHMIDAQPVPYFSASEMHAWSIVMWARKELGWQFTIKTTTSGVDVICECWDKQGVNHGDFAAWAELMPLAVCRAFLKARSGS